MTNQMQHVHRRMGRKRFPKVFQRYVGELDDMSIDLRVIPLPVRATNGLEVFVVRNSLSTRGPCDEDTTFLGRRFRRTWRCRGAGPRITDQTLLELAMTLG